MSPHRKIQAVRVPQMKAMTLGEVFDRHRNHTVAKIDSDRGEIFKFTELTSPQFQENRQVGSAINGHSVHGAQADSDGGEQDHP